MSWLPIRRSLVVLALLFCPAELLAKSEWHRGADLELAITRADLILIAQATEISESKTVYGGKAERTTRQFQFKPIRTLKGIFARDKLLMTTDDLGIASEGIERGQMRLFLLGRSQQGYFNCNQSENLDQSMLPIKDERDPLLSAVQVLIAVTQQPDRAAKSVLLRDGLRTAEGPGTVPLLIALRRRALLAAQIQGAFAAVQRHLAADSPAIVEAAAQTLEALLAADYLNQAESRRAAVTAIAAALAKGTPNVAARTALFSALAAAGPATLENRAAAGQVELFKTALLNARPRDAAENHNAAALRMLLADPAASTYAEQAAQLRAIGLLRMVSQREVVGMLAKQLPIDASWDLQQAAERALVQLDAEQAAAILNQRIKTKLAAGIGAESEILMLGELPRKPGGLALLEVFKTQLTPGELQQAVLAAQKLADNRLVGPLSRLLDPRRPDLRWHATEALRLINTVEAAEALRPHLREEADLNRKLQIAEFLGRHGYTDGYPYAIEHMSERWLTEQAAAALVAIKAPQTLADLTRVYATSNDTAWRSAAIRALGLFGAKDFAPRFLDLTADLRNPLAPAALLALADLNEPKTLARVRAGLSSRNNAVALASVRAAGKLLQQHPANTDDIRDRLAELLADADADAELRRAALDALTVTNDARLNRALLALIRSAADLEYGDLLYRAEKLLRERNVKLDLRAG